MEQGPKTNSFIFIYFVFDSCGNVALDSAKVKILIFAR